MGVIAAILGISPSAAPPCTPAPSVLGTHISAKGAGFGRARSQVQGGCSPWWECRPLSGLLQTFGARQGQSLGLGPGGLSPLGRWSLPPGGSVRAHAPPGHGAQVEGALLCFTALC